MLIIIIFQYDIARQRRGALSHWEFLLNRRKDYAETLYHSTLSLWFEFMNINGCIMWINFVKMIKFHRCTYAEYTKAQGIDSNRDYGFNSYCDI